MSSQNRPKTFSIDSQSYSSDEKSDSRPTSRHSSFEITIASDMSYNEVDIYKALKKLSNPILIETRKPERRKREQQMANMISYSPPNITEYFNRLLISKQYTHK